MHDEAPMLPALFARLDAVLGGLGVASEIICIDDGSADDTYALLAARLADDPRLRVIRLSRNFGKEAALTAGLEAASGDFVVALDADCRTRRS
jgi:glycosyltransferase involved in cell wall biosynthesis